MGIFQKLKELFNKNIECVENMDNHTVFLLENKKFLFLNRSIIVRDGSVCVVVYKSRVADVILPGKYKINEQIIPETFHRSKADKPGKHGTIIHKIRADLYFVNVNEIKQFEFDSDEPFLIKSKDFGRIKGYLKGSCNIRVIDASILIKCLIAENGIEKNKNVNNDIGLWVGNKINKKIEKNKTPIEMIFNNNEYLNSFLNTDLEDAYDNIGIYVKNIKLKAINIPKKYQKKIGNNLSCFQRLNTKAIINNALSGVGMNNCAKVSVQNTSQNMFQNNGAMQNINTMHNTQKCLNVGDFKVCNRCGYKNQINNSICNNCGNKI